MTAQRRPMEPLLVRDHLVRVVLRPFVFTSDNRRIMLT
jgi:hypothetical protein